MGDRTPAFRLVEFHLHRGDDAETEPTNGSEANGSRGSRLRRLGAFLALGGAAVALNWVLGKRMRAGLSQDGRGAVDRLRNTDAINRLRESDYSSRVPGSERIERAYESDRVSRIAGRDPADRLRDESDGTTGDASVGTERDANVDVGEEIDPRTTDVETAEDAGIGDGLETDDDPEAGTDGEAGADEGDPNDATTTEADTPAGTDADEPDGATETDVGLAAKADAETNLDDEAETGNTANDEEASPDDEIAE